MALYPVLCVVIVCLDMATLGVVCVVLNDAGVFGLLCLTNTIIIMVARWVLQYPVVVRNFLFGIVKTSCFCDSGLLVPSIVSYREG